MRRVVYAASFIDEADGIAAYIEARFGSRRADGFRDDLDRFCEALSALPGRGKTDHGYTTSLLGVVCELSWIFFQIADDELRLVHIVPARRLKSAIRF